MPRTRPRPRRKRSPALPALMLLGIAGVIGLAVLRFESLMPIRHVRIEGALANSDPEDFKKALSPWVRHSYFTVDLKALEQAIAAVPWVNTARISRIWPDTIIVEIDEQDPIARWGSDELLGANGEAFKRPAGGADFSGLPMLSGPRGRERQVLEMMAALNEKLTNRHTQVAALHLSSRLAWEARLSNGLEIAYGIAYGNQDPLAAMDRALAWLPRLGEQRMAAIRKLDLRYSSGFAVIWKPAAPAPTSPEQSAAGKKG